MLPVPRDLDKWFAVLCLVRPHFAAISVLIYNETQFSILCSPYAITHLQYFEHGCQVWLHILHSDMADVKVGQLGGHEVRLVSSQRKG